MLRGATAIRGNGGAGYVQHHGDLSPRVLAAALNVEQDCLRPTPELTQVGDCLSNGGDVVHLVRPAQQLPLTRGLSMRTQGPYYHRYGGNGRSPRRPRG
jgi:hypothetical protein